MKPLLQDARHYQMIFLLSFLTYGYFALDWGIEGHQILIIFISGLATHSVFAWRYKLSLDSYKSVLISCTSLSILLRADQTWVYAVAAILAVSAKFIFRFQQRHFINPANAGIILCILLTGKAWLNTGQWGSQALWIFLLGSMGFIVTGTVKRVDVALSFFFSFVLLQYARTVLYLHWPIDHLLHQFANGSMILFTFFMITDPVSTPSHRYVRIGWGILVAITSFILSNFYYLSTAPLWSLFIYSMATPILNYYFPATAFRWHSKSKQLITS